MKIRYSDLQYLQEGELLKLMKTTPDEDRKHLIKRLVRRQKQIHREIHRLDLGLVQKLKLDLHLKLELDSDLEPEQRLKLKQEFDQDLKQQLAIDLSQRMGQQSTLELAHLQKMKLQMEQLRVKNRLVLFQTIQSEGLTNLTKQDQATSLNLAKSPGSWLLWLAEILFSPDRYRQCEEAVADWHVEYYPALDDYLRAIEEKHGTVAVASCMAKIIAIRVRHTWGLFKTVVPMALLLALVAALGKFAKTIIEN